jgi:hypothetical protein
MSLRQALKRTGKARHGTALGEGRMVKVVYINGHKSFALGVPGYGGCAYYATLAEVEYFLYGAASEGWESVA